MISSINSSFYFHRVVGVQTADNTMVGVLTIWNNGCHAAQGPEKIKQKSFRTFRHARAVYHLHIADCTFSLQITPCMFQRIAVINYHYYELHSFKTFVKEIAQRQIYVRTSHRNGDEEKVIVS